MTANRKLRRAAFGIVTLAVAALLVGVASGGLRSRPKSTTLHTTAADCTAPAVPGEPAVDVGNAPAAEADLIRTSAARVGTTLVSAIRLGDPPDPTFTPLAGYPGDRWLYVDVGIPDAQSCRVQQDWEAARLAGDVRNAAAAAGLPTPFGYSVVGVLGDGTRLQPVSIVIGAPIGTAAGVTPDRAAEAARIHQAAAAAGLSVRSLVFAGADGASIVRARGSGSRADTVRRFPTLLLQLEGRRGAYAWLVEVDGPDGVPIKAFANSPTTAGANGWIAPDLRIADLEASNGG
jgi:hypothetical protein